MEQITERQKTILALVVRDYIETAQPVGSNHLLERFKLDVSSATVRNEMAALTEAGYLRQPHASAGRIPSEDGYRYFVTHYVYQTDLPEPTRHTITHQFYQARQDVDQWMHLDLLYMDRRSLLLDLKILVQTIPAVLQKTGAY